MQTNLDKICAEYGMDLLNHPAELYKQTNNFIKNSSDFNDFKSKNYDKDNLNNSLKNFLKFKLINPLRQLQNKEKKFNQLKAKNNTLSFDSKTFETETTKALGILVEDGPFAYCIWLKSQDKEPHQAMLIQTARILMALNLINDISPDKNLKEELEKAFLEQISTDLTKTLFVKTILEKMLIYARYKAKAMQHE